MAPVNDPDTTQDTSGWLSVQAAARAYGVNPRTIRRRIARGELAALQIVGEHGPEYRVPPPAGATHPYTPLDTAPDSGRAVDSPPVTEPGALVPVIQQYVSALQGQLADLQAARLADARQIGALEERIAHLQAELEQAHATPPARPAWWRRLLGQG
jgi:hypothetical protein